MRLDNSQKSVDQLVMAYELNIPIAPISPSTPIEGYYRGKVPDDTFLVVTTSGSTGSPRPVRSDQG
jgi:long-subunit acyl-CoA synthetase (AMP-forming)